MKNIYIILLSCLTLVAHAQHKVVGKVTDQESGEPLIGVSILLEGTSTGTITDIDGNYVLTIPDENATLKFSFIGYMPQSVVVGDRTVINLGMEVDVTSLEEVIVVGYGEQKKVNLTGAVENVSLDDVETRVMTNSSQVLQGKVSGIQIVQNSGQPGQDDATIRIRGVSSIANNNEPLVIIDGVQGELSDVHPSDIASMSVLKDASSAAIYGNRASAGVILIETKKGKKGLKINYTGTISLQQPTALPKTTDAATYAELYNEGRINSGYPVSYDSADIAAYRSGEDPRFASVDWYDKYFDKAVMQNHYLNLGGGEYGKYNFSVSGGFLDQEGVLIGTSSEKISYRIGLNTFFLDKKLRVSAMVNGYKKSDQELSSSTTTVLTTAATSRPTAFFQAVDTTTNQGLLYGYGAQYFANKEAGGGITRDRRYTKYQINAELEPVPGITGRVLYGQSDYDYKYIRLVPSVPLAGNPFDGEGTVTSSSLDEIMQKNVNTTLFTTLELKKNFGPHYFSLLGGFERLEYTTEVVEAGIKNLLANEPVFSLGDASTRYLSGDAYENATQSVFGRFNYALLDRYLVEFNVRRDGSSRFAAGNRYGVFPSVSAGWRISEEPFMESQNIVTNLKVRASWGRLGNQNINSSYAAYDKLDPGQNYTFGGQIVPGTGTTLLANRNVSWETSEQTDIGVDMEFVDRISFTFDYFSRTNRDLLLQPRIPGSLGTSETPIQNIGAMSNKGFELGAFYRSDLKKKLQYEINVNASYTKSKVLDIGPLEYLEDRSIISGYSPPGGMIRSYVGQQFASYYGYIAEGIYQVDEFDWQSGSDESVEHSDRAYILKEGVVDPSEIMANPAPGDIKFKDLNGDGFVTEEDKTIIGNSQPKWIFSFNFNATYKNFYLNVLAQGVAKSDAYLMGSLITPFWNGNGPISQEMAENRWTYENPSETHQRLYSDIQRANIVSTYYIEDASYLRVKNIQLGYTIPSKVFGFKNDEKIKVFCTIENAFTLTSFSGFDPERTYNKVTGDFHPQVRIYTAGVNIQF